ncbi:MAG: hypothetical protein PHC53_00270 [Patescibacteria group bacterium]|nr:hypothetical protein [Patescibacteria group bacterium]
MKAQFVRRMSQSSGSVQEAQGRIQRGVSLQEVLFYFTTKKDGKDYTFIVSSFGKTKEACDWITLFFMGETGLALWPSGTKSVTAEITLPDGSIKKTWHRPVEADKKPKRTRPRDRRPQSCDFNERLRLPEEAGRPLFEVELTFELGQPDLPKPRKSPFSPSYSAAPR